MNQHLIDTHTRSLTNLITFQAREKRRALVRLLFTFNLARYLRTLREFEHNESNARRALESLSIRAASYRAENNDAARSRRKPPETL